MDEDRKGGLLSLTAEVVANYARNNRIRPEELIWLLEEVRTTFARLKSGETVGPAAAAAARKPAVPVNRSVTPDYIYSLEDGQKFRSLKRHLMSAYGMTPQEYRERWNLPPDYPMVAPRYAEQRSQIAKEARAEQLEKQGKRGRGKG